MVSNGGLLLRWVLTIQLSVRLFAAEKNLIPRRKNAGPKRWAASQGIFSVINTAEIKTLDLLPIVEAAGVQMRKSGSKWVGCCPMHDEKTGSFFVFPDNHFKCFGCQESGDIIDFVRKTQGIGFMEACNYLGIENRRPTPKLLETIRTQQKKKAVKEAFEHWRDGKIDEYATLYRCSSRVLHGIKTLSDLERMGDLYHAKQKWQRLYHLFYLEADKATLFKMFQQEAHNNS